MDIRASRLGPNQFAKSLFAGLPPRYDRLAAILSLGQDRRWRTAMIDHVVPAKPALVLDVATGPAGVARQLANRTDAQIIGVDLSEPMLRQGVCAIAAANLHDRILLTVGGAERLPFADATFDALTFTYLLRYVTDPAATLRELARVLKPGAPIASLEFAVPQPWWWHRLWWLYTRAVLPVAGLVGGGRAWYSVGRFLGPSISRHYEQYPVDWTIAAWQQAGLDDVQTRRMSLGGGLVMWGHRATHV